MARLPKIRASYSSDAAYLYRLIQAIERDPKRPNDWKRGVIDQLQQLANELMKAPTITVKSDAVKKAS
jgi:hypothetical protein